MSIETIDYKAWQKAIDQARAFVASAEEALKRTIKEDADWSRHMREMDAWSSNGDFGASLASRPAPAINMQASIYRAAAKRSSMDLTRSLVPIRRPQR